MVAKIRTRLLGVAAPVGGEPVQVEVERGRGSLARSEAGPEK